jgi:hypothetical protein
MDPRKDPDFFAGMHDPVNSSAYSGEHTESLAPELRLLVRKAAQQAAAEYLINRTIPEWPAYFMEGRWLVTYDYLQREMQELRLRIAALEAARRPWWKRWLRR